MANAQMNQTIARASQPLPPGADESRLTLAKWITDPKSPTTARVFVNRMWQAYFGTGIVGTPEDFGMQVEAPHAS